MKRIITTDKAPRAIGPYSQAVEVNGVLYISGQIALDPTSGKIVEGGVSEQVSQVLRNIGEILHVAGYDYGDVVKTTVLLEDMDSFKEMNEVYAGFYRENPPARAAYAVKKLPMGALVEIETIAAK